MTWWEIIATFVGIPIVVVLGVGALVFWATEARLPDGLAAARDAEDDPAGQGRDPDSDDAARTEPPEAG